MQDFFINVHKSFHTFHVLFSNVDLNQVRYGISPAMRDIYVGLSDADRATQTQIISIEFIIWKWFTNNTFCIHCNYLKKIKRYITITK